MTDVATLPLTAHLSILKKHIEDEKLNRLRYLKGARQNHQVADSNQALKSLDAVIIATQQLHGDRP